MTLSPATLRANPGQGPWRPPGTEFILTLDTTFFLFGSSLSLGMDVAMASSSMELIFEVSGTGLALQREDQDFLISHIFLALYL